MGYFIHLYQDKSQHKLRLQSKTKNKQTAEYLIPPKSQGEDNMMEAKKEGL